MAYEHKYTIEVEGFEQLKQHVAAINAKLDEISEMMKQVEGHSMTLKVINAAPARVPNRENTGKFYAN